VHALCLVPCPLWRVHVVLFHCGVCILCALSIVACAFLVPCPLWRMCALRSCASLIRCFLFPSGGGAAQVLAGLAGAMSDDDLKSALEYCRCVGEWARFICAWHPSSPVDLGVVWLCVDGGILIFSLSSRCLLGAAMVSSLGCVCQFLRTSPPECTGSGTQMQSTAMLPKQCWLRC
jgi:hypothetical protein